MLAWQPAVEYFPLLVYISSPGDSQTGHAFGCLFVTGWRSYSPAFQLLPVTGDYPQWLLRSEVARCGFFFNCSLCLLCFFRFLFNWWSWFRCFQALPFLNGFGLG